MFFSLISIANLEPCLPQASDPDMTSLSKREVAQMQKHASRSVSPLFYLAIALLAVFATTMLFFARATAAPSLSPVAGLMHLKAMERTAMPYEEAIANRKPTLVEFYADWCSSCQAMATTVEELRDRYGHDINFVMLDIDNPARSTQVKAYGVTGVPHFVTLDANQAVADSIVGRVPAQVLSQTFDRLLEDRSRKDGSGHDGSGDENRQQSV